MPSFASEVMMLKETVIPVQKRQREGIGVMMLGIDVDVEVYRLLTERSKASGLPLNEELRNVLMLKPGGGGRLVGNDELYRSGATANEGAYAVPRQVPKDVSRIACVAVLGAAGKIGDKIVDEARSRGLEVIAIARDPSKLSAQHGVTPRAADANDAVAIIAAVGSADALVVSVKWPAIEIASLIDAVRRSGLKRAIFVVGNGASLRSDGRRQFVHMAESNGVPVPASVPAVRVVEALKNVDDLEWSVITCPVDIRSGERVGQFRISDERIVFDSAGKSAISEQDFAIAILDELQEPHHIRAQFCVGY